ncbi:MAG: hypothetical protein QW254_03715 [Desulfurococcaceae archaeon]
MSSREIRRRFIPIQEQLIEEAMKISEKTGIPYIVLIERIVGDVLRILRYKPSILDALVLADALDDAKRLGGFVLPWEIAKKIIGEMSDSDFKELVKEAEKACTWFGELSRVKRGSSPRELSMAISIWIPSSTVDVIAEGSGVYKFVVSIMDSNQRVIELAEAVIKGLLKGYGLGVVYLEKGFHTISFRVSGFLEKE